VYVQSYPPGGGKWQISTDGGAAPSWRRPDEIFYKNGKKLMSVEVKTTPSFSAGTPRVLFEKSFSEYDVSPDGTRIALVETSEDTSSGDQIQVIINWFDELRERLGISGASQ
jgi:hypothetical protein